MASTGNIVYGNIDNDVLTDNSNANTLYGGQGNDLLVSNTGSTNTVLVGGQGNDTFQGGSATDNTSTSATTITDFVSGTDKVDFGTGATSATTANFSTATISTNNLQTAFAQASTAAGTYTFVKGASESFLFYNTEEGSQAFILSNGATLVASDIIAGPAAPAPNNPA